MGPSSRIPLTVLRIGAAAVMIVHGLARIHLGIVDDFGVVLGQWGFPAGYWGARAITTVEIVGGLALAAGLLVRPIALWFIVQLSMGIYLIHWAAGWFVVGAGRNGMEFSALLILCFAVTAMAAPRTAHGTLTNQTRRRSV